MPYKKPNGYDSVRNTDYKPLPAGGYICRILKAEETRSKSGKDMIKIAFDIADGEHTGYFLKQFNDRKDAAELPGEVKWPFSGTKWILLEDNEGKASKTFVTFCTSLEESGTKVWKDGEIDAKWLKDALVGILFRREEHEYNGTTSWRTVPCAFRSVDTISKGEFKVPEDKPLPAMNMDYGKLDSFSAAEDDIPFK